MVLALNIWSIIKSVSFLFWPYLSRGQNLPDLPPPSGPKRKHHTKNLNKDLLNKGIHSGSEVWIHYALKK